MPDETDKATIGHPLLLWTGWVLGPVAWAVHLLASYVMVWWVCATGYYWALHALTLATLLLALGGVWVAWRQWSAVGRQWPGGGGGDPASRIRFMAVGGIVVSSLSALLIAAEGIGNFMLSACL